MEYQTMTLQDTGSNTLTHARELIGSVHPLRTYTRIQTYEVKLVQTDYRNLLMMTTLGMQVIKQALQDAAYYVTHTSGTFNRKAMTASYEAYMFVQGTGLEMVIQKFAIDLNAEVLKEEFNKIFDEKREA
jgi:hypothetical protein